MTALRHRKKYVTRLRDLNGSLVDQEEDLKQLAKTFYINLYVEERVVELDIGTLKFPILNCRDKKLLNRMISEGDIKFALSQMALHKAQDWMDCHRTSSRKFRVLWALRCAASFRRCLI